MNANRSISTRLAQLIKRREKHIYALMDERDYPAPDYELGMEMVGAYYTDYEQWQELNEELLADPIAAACEHWSLYRLHRAIPIAA